MPSVVRCQHHIACTSGHAVAAKPWHAAQGAARLLDWSDLDRFRELPLLVKFKDRQEDQVKEAEKILYVDSLDDVGRIVVWRLADITANYGALWNNSLVVLSLVNHAKCTYIYMRYRLRLCNCALTAVQGGLHSLQCICICDAHPVMR